MNRLVRAAAWFAVVGLAETRFHHVAVNVTDRQAAIDFYTKRFECERAKFNGIEDAVWTQKSWIFLNQVKADPPHEIQSAIWHIGWGAEDMKKEYRRQLDLGTKFETPITDTSKLANFNGFFYDYVDGPSHSLIELNTAGHRRFGYLHLLSDDPIAAAEWYAEKLGMPYEVWERYHMERLKIRALWREYFRQFDVLLTPVAIVPAIQHDHSMPRHRRVVTTADGSRRPYGELSPWIAPAGLSGCPATIVPVALSAQGLPIGIQVIGPFLEDLTTIHFARLLAREFASTFRRPTLS